MNNHQINSFLEVAKEKNFTKAAANLYQTQPGISRCIAGLEQELNTTLFVRHSNKSLELTESGKLFYEFFFRMRREFYAVKSESDQRQRLSAMNLKFGYATGWIISNFLPAMLHTIKSKFPHFNMDIECHGFPDMTQLLKTNELDIILTLEHCVADEPGLGFCKICDLPQVILYSDMLEISGKVDSLKDFEQKTFVIANGIHFPEQKQKLSSLCQEYGFQPRIIPVTNQATMISYVENQKGVALMDLWSQPIHMNQFSYFTLEIFHSVVLAYRKECEQSNVIKEIAKTLSGIQ